eukprot:gene14121-biopygen37032
MSPPLVRRDGRCGPLFGNAVCGGVVGGAGYCNTQNGWCGGTTRHRDAQPGDRFDSSRLPAHCRPTRPPTTAPPTGYVIYIFNSTVGRGIPNELNVPLTSH